jgi:hypothetical protein
MTENAKTLTLVAVAAVVVLVAFLGRPSLQVATEDDMQGKPLYDKFIDPLAVTKLDIVEFDDQRGDVLPFQVAQVDVKGKTRWSIPSHDEYPADAKDQVASAAAGLMGLKVIEMVSDNQGDQREYGVIDPDPSKPPKLGDTGVGTRVVMKDKSGKELLALVIGKEVKDRPGLRYVRKVGQAPIYIVQAKTDKLSTKFENWIERNLLGINTFDIKRLWVRDHSVDQLNAALIQRGETTIEYNDTGEPKWKLFEDRKFKTSKQDPEAGKWVTVKMPDNEELNTAKLDELKTALDDLKIVDVARKPKGLSADLKAAGDFKSNREAVESLARKGFFVAELTPGRPEVFSNEGEIRLVMKDGVEYVLRFGEIAGTGASKKDEKKGKETEEDKKGSGVNRYLFVMAEFDPNIIPKPQLEAMPAAKKEADKKPAAEKKTDEKKMVEKKIDAKADEKKPEVKKADEKKPADKKPDEKKSEEKKAEDKKAEQAERERIEKDNKRKQEEYDQKIADGKKRVAELNDRFADWYYVISDEVYRKIHLGHGDIFKKKEKPKDQDKAKNGQPGEKPAPTVDIEKLKEEGPGGK